MGSISKQFTAASVVLAAEQGFFSLDDNVRKYIPELPDYGHPITLRQMLHHTSGLRDFFALLYLSGRNPADFHSQEELLDLIVHQKGLNNIPEDEFIYSNTNYFLLGEVVKRATRKSLADFASENIFRPLGMTHTRFYDDHTFVLSGRVSAYDPGNDGRFLVDWSTSYDTVGAGGLVSSVDDLLLETFTRTSWERERWSKICRPLACSMTASRTVTLLAFNWARIAACPSLNTMARFSDTGMQFCASRSSGLR
jgi:CubicO group peptidase (beta-lactamase class C family)